MARKITFEHATACYVHRFTMDHVPAWARKVAPNGKYYAPQYASDHQWYENTAFYGEAGHLGDKTHCHTSGQTWPLGQWLDKPYIR
jgi:hypothetical protein